MDYEKKYTEALASAFRYKKKWLTDALAKEARKYLEDIGGDMTDRVLEDYFLDRSLKKNQRQGLLVQ